MTLRIVYIRRIGWVCVNVGAGAKQGYTKYPATDKAAKDRAYQIARESAELMRLRIVDERVE